MVSGVPKKEPFGATTKKRSEAVINAPMPSTKKMELNLFFCKNVCIPFLITQSYCSSLRRILSFHFHSSKTFHRLAIRHSTLSFIPDLFLRHKWLFHPPQSPMIIGIKGERSHTFVLSFKRKSLTPKLHIIKTLTHRFHFLLTLLISTAVTLCAQPRLESVGIIKRYADGYNTGGFFRLEKGPAATTDYDMHIQWDEHGRLLSFNSASTDSLINDQQYRCSRTQSGHVYTYTTEMREPMNGIPQYTIRRKEIVHTDDLGNDTLITTLEYEPYSGFPMYSYNLRFTPVQNGVGFVRTIVNGALIRLIELHYNSHNLIDSVIEHSYTSDPGSMTLYHYSGQKLDSITDLVLTPLNNYEVTARTILTTGSHGFSTSASIYSVQNGVRTLEETLIFNRGLPIGLTDDNSAAKWRVYPNPAEDFIRLDGLETDSPFALYSMTGTEVKSGEITNGARIKIDDLPAGMYIIRIGQHIERLLVH